MPALLPDYPHCPVVLACDTSQRACSVALALTNGDIIERLEETGRGHTEKLPLMIKDILASTGVGLQDVDRLGVTIGPGTFAGVRVGLAAMRAIRVSHHLPIYSITTTHALALGFEVGAHDEARPIVFDEADRHHDLRHVSRSNLQFSLSQKMTLHSMDLFALFFFCSYLLDNFILRIFRKDLLFKNLLNKLLALA